MNANGKAKEYILWKRFGEILIMSRHTPECDESGQQCETRLSIFYQADAEGNSLLECVSRQTDSFGEELVEQATVTIQKVTTLIERWTTTEILLLIFLILLILLLLILLILAIIYGWCCFAKKERQEKKLPDTKSMVGPPPPPTKVAEHPTAPPPVYSIEDARKQNSSAPPLPPKDDRAARDFQSKGVKSLDSDDYFDDEERHRKKKRRKRKKRPQTDSTEGLPPLPLKVTRLDLKRKHPTRNSNFFCSGLLVGRLCPDAGDPRT